MHGRRGADVDITRSSSVRPRYVILRFLACNCWTYYSLRFGISGLLFIKNKVKRFRVKSTERLPGRCIPDLATIRRVDYS